MALGAALGQGRQNGTQSFGEGLSGMGPEEAMGMKLVGELVAFLF